MKKLLIILLLIVGCAVNVGHNPILTLNIATKQSEKSCLKECEEYAKSSEDMEDITDEALDPVCICMHDCTKNENWCEDQQEYWSPVDSTVTEE